MNNYVIKFQQINRDQNLLDKKVFQAEIETSRTP